MEFMRLPEKPGKYRTFFIIHRFWQLPILREQFRECNPVWLTGCLTKKLRQYPL